tara:strand:- start:294 stop:1001 length:708 start_codon:yes stop_codon:yes gene_type:complete
MGNSTTKSLNKPYSFEKGQSNINHLDNNIEFINSTNEQNEIQILRQQLNEDITKEKTRLFLESIDFKRVCIINLILKLVDCNIKNKSHYATAELISKKINSISFTKKRYNTISHISNGFIMEKQIFTYRTDIINRLSNYVSLLRNHFGDNIPFILQNHFDLTTHCQEYMIKNPKTKINMKNVNWTTLTPNDTNKIYSHFIQQYSHQEWKSVVKPHPNKKEHLIFNANYLKLKKNK